MNISYNQVETYCNDLHALSGKMKETLQKIEESGMKINKSECWVGNASEFFVKKISVMSNNFEQIYNEIETSILYMAKCSSGYQAIDQKIMSEICENLNLSEPSLSKSEIFN